MDGTAKPFFEAIFNIPFPSLSPRSSKDLHEPSFVPVNISLLWYLRTIDMIRDRGLKWFFNPYCEVAFI